MELGYGITFDFNYSKAKPEKCDSSSKRRSGLPRLTSAFPVALHSSPHSSSSPSPDPYSPLPRFHPLNLKRMFSSGSRKGETQGNTQNEDGRRISPEPPTALPLPQETNLYEDGHCCRKSCRDESSVFSRELAIITSGSNEDIWESCPSCVSDPTSAWLTEVSRCDNERGAVTKDSVGLRVLVSGKEEGVLRYFGRTAFASGYWCGIELERCVGKNAGSINGVIYFSCTPGHGIFAPVSKVSILQDSSTEEECISNYNPRNHEALCKGNSGNYNNRDHTNERSFEPPPAETYTMVVGSSGLSSPEEYKTYSVSKGNSGAEGANELTSPAEATLEDSSLGILSPDQMLDFTTSLGCSPSDDDVAAMVDEVCDEGATGRGVPTLERWNSEDDEVLFHKDISVIISEIESGNHISSGAAHPDSKMAFAKSQPSCASEAKPFHLGSFVSGIPKTSESDTHKETRYRSYVTGARSRNGRIKSSSQNISVRDKLSKEPTKPIGIIENMKTAVCTETAKCHSDSLVKMDISAVSIDTGYQGDGEFDAPSLAGSVTASSPMEDSRLLERIIDMERTEIDQSTGVTEADVSLADDNAELECEGLLKECASRVVDAKIFVNQKELMVFRHPEVRHEAHTSEMDSSGFYSDLDPRDEESTTRLEIPSLQPLTESKMDGDLVDSLLDDTTNEYEEIMEYATVTKEVDNKQKLRLKEEMKNEDERISRIPLKKESKDTPCSGDHSSGTEEQKAPSQNAADSSLGVAGDPQDGSQPQNSSENNGIVDSSNLKESEVNGEATKDESDPPTRSQDEEKGKSRKYDKPWLSKPPPRKVEKSSPVPPIPAPVMPKRNVQSKLKMLLECSEPRSEERHPRLAKKGRWDDVMNRIEEGKKKEEERPNTKEVKSRLMESLKVVQAPSPHVERMRQERRERRERRERHAAAIRRNNDRKHSNASSLRTSRAPSLESVGGPGPPGSSRASTPDVSQPSSSSSSTSLAPSESRSRSGLSRDPKLTSTGNLGGSSGRPGGCAGSQDGKKDSSLNPQSPVAGSNTRRVKVDSTKAPQRTIRKHSDPVKVLRSSAAAPNVRSWASPSDQLKKLEVELSARTEELRSREKDSIRATRGLEALTVVVHYLVQEYEAFSTPLLKAEIESLCKQVTELRLSLDESRANVRLLEEESTKHIEKHSEEMKELEDRLQCRLEALEEEHRRASEGVNQKYQMELSDCAAATELKEKELSILHRSEWEKRDREWVTMLEKERNEHLSVVDRLTASHFKQVKETEQLSEGREKELADENAILSKEQNRLKQETKKLEETLLSDQDQRLQGIKRVCSGLQNEVDSLKAVIEMRNGEIHSLRDQLIDKERMSEELIVAKDRVRSLNAKTEDLHAQMEKKLKFQRKLLADQQFLAESFQRESCLNKRLSLENEELQWKLRQREEAEAGSLPSATLNLMTRCLAEIPSTPEPGSISPKSPSLGSKKSQRLPEKELPFCGKEWDHWRLNEELKKAVSESPSVKGVIEKSNSVSFILDLNDTFPEEEPFLWHPSPPLPRPHLKKALKKSNSVDKGEKVRRVKSSPKETLLLAASPSEGNPDRVSLTWTIPSGCLKHRSEKYPRDFKDIPTTLPRLLQRPDEDEYEEVENEFVEVVALKGEEDLTSAPLTTLFAQTPSTSVSLSDSDASQYGSREDLSSEDSEEDAQPGGWKLKEGAGVQEGAGEAMILPDGFGFKGAPGDRMNDVISKSQVSSSAPSSDSEDPHSSCVTETGINGGWLACDFSSISEMQEL